MSEKKKLTRAERKQIEAAIARANRTDKKEKSAQDSIPYQRMWPDGICRVTNTRYTKTIQYQDINYQLSQNEDKTAIFEAWCDFLNYFDSSVQFQLSFVNLSASQETFARSISIPPCGDEFDGIRAEYAGMLQNQLARGNNGLIKTKYLTFGVEADNLRAAKPRLERKLFPFKSTTIGSCFDVCFSVYSVLTYLFSADTLLHVTVLSFVKVVVFLIGPSSDTGGLSSSGVNTYCPWPFSFLNVMSSMPLA